MQSIIKDAGQFRLSLPNFKGQFRRLCDLFARLQKLRLQRIDQ